MNLVTPDLLYISTVAHRAGLMALIDGQSVAIFLPVHHPAADGVEHHTFRVVRVHTVNEAWNVVRTAGEVPALAA